MFTEKYRPKSLKEITGQEKTIKEILLWLRNPKKPLLIYGLSGTGKTIIPHVIANENEYDIIEINASDIRTKLSIEKILSSTIKQKSLFKKGKIILIDDIDALSSSDRGATGSITKIIKESKFPIILTADNAYSPKLKNIRNYCKLIQLKKLRTTSIEKKLKEVAEKEKIKINENNLKLIAKQSQGDLRAALNDLENLSNGNENFSRDKEKNIFEVLRVIFKSKDIEEVKKAIRESDKNIEEIFWWLEQNIPIEYEKPEEVAKAFDFLSKADLFRSKIIKNQNYRFLIYMQDMIAAVSLAKKNPYYKFTSYRPPNRLLILGRTKMQRQELNILTGALGKKLHCSKKIVKNDVLPYLKIIYGENIFKDS